MAATVPYKSTAYQSKAGAPVDSVARDWRDQCEQLRKELDRKDQRNEKMTKEMQQIRSSYADLQREMRLTVSTIDKIKSERKHFEDQANELKIKNQGLAKRLQTANDPSGLINQISQDRKDHLFLNENIVNLRSELSLREMKIEALQKELVIAHRAMEAQNKYEHLLQPNVSNNREIMRTLYFDMGKKQADLHSVTLALAEVSQKLERTETILAQTTQIKEIVHADNEKLRGNIEFLNRQSIEYNDEIDRLRGEIDRGERLCEHLQRRVEDTSAELEAANAHHAEVSHDQRLHIDSLSSDVGILQQDKSDLQARVEHLQAAAVTSDEICRVREAELHDHIARLQSKNDELSDKSQLCSTLQAALDELRARQADTDAQQHQQEQRISELLRLLSNKEQEATQASTSVHALEAHLSALHVELSKFRDQCTQASSERDEALEALRQTMRATRDLSQKFHHERELRESMERTNEQLLQAKANLSNATLDALYQERRKSAALEKSLALVPLVLKWRSACISGPSAAEAAYSAAGAYAQSFSSSSGVDGVDGVGSSSTSGEVGGDGAEMDKLTQQASQDVNFVAHNISGIAQQLDTSAGLHEGVNATFDWLLSENNVPARVSPPPSGVAGPTGAAETVSLAAGEASAAEEGKSGSAADASEPAGTPMPVQTVSCADPAQHSSLPGVQASRAFAPASPTRSPGIAAAMVEAYKHLDLPPSHRILSAAGLTDTEGQVGSPSSMMGELKRLRDELRKIEETAPANTSYSTNTSVQPEASFTATVSAPAPSARTAVHSSTFTSLHRSAGAGEASSALATLTVNTSTNITGQQ